LDAGFFFHNICVTKPNRPPLGNAVLCHIIKNGEFSFFWEFSYCLILSSII
jgi:hypothetical protein